jgi:predicted GNAT superfamily acetyltransferase
MFRSADGCTEMCAVRVRPAESADAATLQSVVSAWWGRPLESDMLSPFFLTHFRDTCLIAERNGATVGFLIGFLSQARADEAYIRLIVVHPEHRGAGIGHALYERFFDVVRQHGRRTVRSVTSPSNQDSAAFHARMGFTLEPQAQEVDGLPVCRNYHGRAGTDRILFVKTLD